MDYCMHFFKDKQLTTVLTDFRTLPRKVVLMVKNLPVNEGDARDTGSIPGLGRSPGKGNGNPVQYSCLENSMDRGAWQATVHGVAKSCTWLIEHTCTHSHPLIWQFDFNVFWCRFLGIHPSCYLLCFMNLNVFSFPYLGSVQPLFLQICFLLPSAAPIMCIFVR